MSPGLIGVIVVSQLVRNHPPNAVSTGYGGMDGHNVYRETEFF